MPTYTPVPTETPTRTPTLTLLPTSTSTATEAATPAPVRAVPSPASAFTRPPDVIEAKVVRVHDGDTIEVEIKGRPYEVRYIGISCPEFMHPTKGTEPMGLEATEANKQMVEGQIVGLEKDVSETDSYGRLLRYVWAGEVMVNAELVRLGYAKAIAYPPDTKYHEYFLTLQQEARKAGRGIWSITPTPTPIKARLTITALSYKGADEYVEITNAGPDQDMTGWRILSVRGYQEYRFPDGYVLRAGTSVRVHSGPKAMENPPADLKWGTEYIWNNDGDEAVLYDAQGHAIAQRAY